MAALLHKRQKGHLGDPTTYSLILYTSYVFLTMAFIPLFAAIMVKFKARFAERYYSVKNKLIVGFIIFALVLIIRLVLYTLLLFAIRVKYFMDVSFASQIPFYVSEIMITLFLSLI
jgi:hypothetical protein